MVRIGIKMTPSVNLDNQIYEETAQFANFRLLHLSLLAALIGIIAGFVAYLLVSLIGLISNLVFYQQVGLEIQVTRPSSLRSLRIW